MRNSRDVDREHLWRNGPGSGDNAAQNGRGRDTKKRRTKKCPVRATADAKDTARQTSAAGLGRPAVKAQACCCRLGVQFRAEFPRQTEHHDLARGQGDGFVRFGVAPLTRCLVIAFEFAKSADKQSPVLLDGGLHYVQQFFNHVLYINAVLVGFFVDSLHDVRFGQCFFQCEFSGA